MPVTDSDDNERKEFHRVQAEGYERLDRRQTLNVDFFINKISALMYYEFSFPRN